LTEDTLGFCLLSTMAACDGEMTSVNAAFGGPTVVEVSTASMQQTAVVRTQSELELEFNPMILVNDTSDEEDAVCTQNLPAAVVPEGKNTAAHPGSAAQTQLQPIPSEEHTVSSEGLAEPALEAETQIQDSLAMDLAVAQEEEDREWQPVEASHEESLGAAPPEVQGDAAMKFGNRQEGEGTQAEATAAEKDRPSATDNSTQELTEVRSSSFQQQELLAQLQSRVAAWKEECQSVSLEELWQLHAAANDFGADVEALRLLGLDIISLESKLKDSQQGSGVSPVKQDAAASLEPADAALDVTDDLAMPQVKDAQKDMTNGQGELCQNLGAIQAKPDCSAALAIDIATALDAELASDMMKGMLPSGPQAPQAAEDALFTLLPVDDTVDSHPSGHGQSTVLPIADTVTDDLPGNVQAQPQVGGSRWFSCTMCSRRSREPSKRKADNDAEVLMGAGKKHRKL